MKSPICTIMVGLPGSGKSTIAEGMSLPILSRDAIVLELAKTDDYTVAFNTVDHRAVDVTLMDRFYELTASSTDFIIDMTSLSVGVRGNWLDKLPNAYSAHAIYVVESDDVIIARRTCDATKQVPLHVIERMMDSLVRPTCDEGFERIDIFVGGTLNSTEIV